MTEVTRESEITVPAEALMLMMVETRTTVNLIISKMK